MNRLQVESIAWAADVSTTDERRRGVRFPDFLTISPLIIQVANPLLAFGAVNVRLLLLATIRR